MSGERFYRDPPTVVRERYVDGSLEISVYNVELRRWVLVPHFLGRILGIGGDGLDRISREDADATLAKYPPKEAPA